MPIIEISKKDLEKLCCKKLDLEKVFSYTKIGIESQEGDALTLEIKDSNRPDLLSAEGIARELKGIIGKEKGLAEYKASKSNFVLNAEKVKARPEIACAVIKGLKLDDYAIKQMIQLQEKLCESFGRKREEIALGIYDFDRIKWPITYKSTSPDGIKFVPLGMDEKLTPRQILSRHEKGKEYAFLLENEKEYPVLVDSNNEVLSLPPIINSNYSGKITEKTRNLFVEATGHDFKKLIDALNITVSALAERNGEIFSVCINKSGKKLFSPDFSARKKKLSAEDVKERIGIDLNEKQIVNLLEKARYSAKCKNKQIEAEIPFYRIDVLHPVDIIEDIAIAYGYDKIVPQEIKTFTTGSVLEETKRAKKIASLMIGLGFQELVSLNLSNKEDLFKKMNMQEKEIIEIENPVSQTFTCLRSSLIPSLMNVLSQNTTKEYPQKIFETGNAVEKNNSEESSTIQKFAAAISDSTANFTEIKQVLDFLLIGLDKKYEIKPVNHESFIDGRAGAIMIKNKQVGIIGEINPQVLSNWGIEMPVVAFEIGLT